MFNVVAGEDYFSRIFVAFMGVGPAQGDIEANARLIAAAPDLAEALRKALREIEARIRTGAADAGFPAEQIASVVDTNPAVIAARAALSRLNPGE